MDVRRGRGAEVLEVVFGAELKRLSAKAEWPIADKVESEAPNATEANNQTAVAEPGADLEESEKEKVDEGNGQPAQLLFEPSPESPEDMNWWERTWRDLKQKLEEWWEARQADLKEWWEARKADVEEWWEARQADFKEWWEETRQDLEERLQEWLANVAEQAEQEIEQQMNDLCFGAAASLALVLVPFLAARRRDLGE